MAHLKVLVCHSAIDMSSHYHSTNKVPHHIWLQVASAINVIFKAYCAGYDLKIEPDLSPSKIPAPMLVFPPCLAFQEACDDDSQSIPGESPGA